MWPEFAEFSSYTTNAIQKFHSVPRLNYKDIDLFENNYCFI